MTLFLAMKRIDRPATRWTLLGLFLVVPTTLLAIGLLVYTTVDCVQGTTQNTSGLLTDKHYRDGWTETQTVPVQNGPYSHLEVHQTNHPEEFRLDIYDGDGQRSIAVQRATYEHYRVGDWVKLRKWFARRSGCKCFETVL